MRLLREPLDDATAPWELLSSPTQMARRFRVGSPFLICLRKPATGSFAAERGGTNRSTPVWLGVVIHDALFEKKE